MKILVLGGTKFIGRHIVETLFAAGHTISILTRGNSSDELPPEIERLRGDRDLGSAGLVALKDCSWDVCVDVSGYTPRQVRASAEMLLSRIKRYIFISTVSIYQDFIEAPVLENRPRMPAAGEDVTVVNGETYGPLKVTCENIVNEIYGSRCTILRPQIVVGPYDHTGRYAYWVQRAAKGGEMLAPGDGSDHLQVIDVRDLAGFVRSVAENNLEGTFNLAGPRLTWSDFFSMLGVQNAVWVSADILKSANVTFAELPLFLPQDSPRCNLMNVSHDRANVAGLQITEPKLTLRDFQTWIKNQQPAPTLSAEREAELIRMSKKID
ncbi:MAG: NAD-dependent epimerase/dehydratase family protein [Limisphaerales bacterium]